MSDLKEQFPILSDPEWLARRESGWQLLLDNGFKNEYRKKDLEIIRKYFFEGRMLENNPLYIQKGTWILLFPLQTSEGYDYFYEHYDFSAGVLNLNNREVFHSGSDHGMLPEDELAYWEYHLGHEYQPIVKRITPNGIVDLEIDPNYFFYNLWASTFDFMALPLDNYSNKWLKNFDYILSILKFFYSNKIEPSDSSKRIFKKKMTNLLVGKFGKNLQNVTDKHYQICSGVLTKVDEFEYLPENLNVIWKDVKAELKP